MFDLLVFIGRFQPFHNEHKRVIDRALQEANSVLILVGSAGSPRTVRNPFTFEERREFISSCYPIHITNNDGNPFAELPRMFIEPLFDKLYNDTAWEKQVQDIVKKTALRIVNKGGFPLHGLNEVKIGLIGAFKDHTSYYLKKFPQWDSIDVPLDFRLDSTNIRNFYFEGMDNRVAECVPNAVRDFLYTHEDWDVQVSGFDLTEDFEYLCSEYKVIEGIKKKWSVAPYPNKDVTVDAVVEQSGHILLVKRRASPGKGLFALPGGHLEVTERIEDGMIRELHEETRIKIPEAVLRGSIKEVKVFDEPTRSNIGRVITHAHYIHLKDDFVLPKVKGGDDAEKAFWMPIADVQENRMFDDHYHIIQYFTGAN